MRQDYKLELIGSMKQFLNGKPLDRFLQKEETREQKREETVIDVNEEET